MTAKKKQEVAVTDRKLIRLSLHNETHEDVIRIWESCPSHMRHELFASAVRFYFSKRSEILRDEISGVDVNKQEHLLRSKGTNIADLFKVG